MHIAIAGGILHHGIEYRKTLQPTTETMLVEGLRERGHRVTEVSPRNLSILPRLKGLGVDLIHIHHPGRVTTGLGMLPHPIPVVYTPHRTNLPPRKLSAIGHDRLLKRAECVVVLSPSERDLLLRRGVRPRATEIIPNGFDYRPFPFSERHVPHPGHRWRILYVGQLIPAKQPDALLDAVATADLRSRVEVRYVYHRESMLAELRSRARDLDIEDRVEFVGRLHGDALVREYREAHFLVLPSRELEALPSVITEAVFTGLPVIAGDVGGISWQLDGFGFCVSKIDSMKLRLALLEGMEDYRSLVTTGQDSSRRFRERFNIDRMVESHEALYERLLSSGVA